MRAWLLPVAMFSLAVAGGLCACSAPAESPEAGGPAPSGDAGTVDPCADTQSAPDAPLRRLTRDEYDHTVRDLLGDTSRPARAFPPDSEGNGFDNQASSQEASPALVEAYADAAEALAARADLASLLPCSPADIGPEACGRAFIQHFGRRAFRRPLTADEQSRFEALFDDVRSAEGFDAAARTVIEVMLQAPQFLYRIELGGAPAEDTARVRLTGYELASRLSYFLWSSMPDDALLDAAARGELDTPEGIEAQARRMLADDRAREMVRRFAVQWLGLSHFDDVAKDPVRYPDFAAVKPLMQQEAALFVEHLSLDGTGDASRLFTAESTWANDALAQYYGLPPVSGEAFREVSLKKNARVGLLTLGAVLSQYGKFDQSSPVLRGKFVRERLLCQSLPPPPGNVVLDLPPPSTSTTRERYKAHAANPACSGCHALLEPVGFGLEHFDGAGRFRTEENGYRVDAHGEVISAGDLDGPFEGAGELSERLGQSRQVKQCLARQWFRFAVGRGETTSAPDQCALKRVDAAFAASGYDVRELLVAITLTDAFAYRRAIDSGGAP
ncbi:MAG: DUF1592 domain-containing protein [Myxococcaceae bacterium]|nr:DUF1592 domain-containing protein [Myxococcaceae bacterium]